MSFAQSSVGGGGGSSIDHTFQTYFNDSYRGVKYQS